MCRLPRGRKHTDEILREGLKASEAGIAELEEGRAGINARHQGPEKASEAPLSTVPCMALLGHARSRPKKPFGFTCDGLLNGA